jgi:hypothetical protein
MVEVGFSREGQDIALLLMRAVACYQLAEKYILKVEQRYYLL